MRYDIGAFVRPGFERQSQAYSLAFLLLGGRRAANGFLDSVNTDLLCVPRERAGSSLLGLVEVVRVLRREALRLAQSANRS
jgi:hypothetical protein